MIRPVDSSSPSAGSTLHRPLHVGSRDRHCNPERGAVSHLELHRRPHVRHAAGSCCGGKGEGVDGIGQRLEGFLNELPRS